LIWAVKHGQYEDMEGNASRILLDDDEDSMLLSQPKAKPEKKPSGHDNDNETRHPR